MTISIYSNKLNEKTQARRRHTRAVINSHYGKDLTAKDRETFSNAYQDAFYGKTFAEVRGPLFKAMNQASVAHISAEVMDSVLNPKKPRGDGNGQSQEKPKVQRLH